METLNIGVIGTGGMGGRHVNNISNEVAAANVVAIMDVDEARLQELSTDYGIRHAFTDAQALINHPDVEAVIIASPDRFHADQAHACIAAGKPVLCEKPLATSAAEAKKVIDAEVAHGTRLAQLGFMSEYDPAHVRVKQVADSGELGRSLVFRGVHINPTKDELRTIEDVITNSAIHDIHSARWMMGDDVTRAYASYIPGDAEHPLTARFVAIQLTFGNGGLGTIECNSESGYGYEVDVKITGETGSVETNPRQSAVIHHGNARRQWVEADWLQRFEVAYIDEVRAWVQSVLDGKPTGPSAWDGYAAMVVADACVESAKSGQAVAIVLPQQPNIYQR
ncbi:MAG: Gfo/Idh/MocA family oxidoreductase [Chloroflexota bacterium]